MKAAFPLVLTFTIVAALVFAAEPPKSTVPPHDKLHIQCWGGVEITNNFLKIVYRDQVRAISRDLYLECEKLTLLRKSNNTSRVAAGKNDHGGTNLNVELDLIIAETNLMLIAQGTTILGDRAVYVGSNETIHVTGDLVVIDNTNGMGFMTNFVVNLRENSMHAVGWTATSIEIDGISGTNAPRPGLGLGIGRKPDAKSKPKNEGSK